MYACVSEESAIIQEYKKLPSLGPWELIQAMIRSIEEANKPSKRGKKQQKKKEGKVIKGAKGKTPRKRKTEKAAPSQPKYKKTKKRARRLILQFTSDSDSDYVPIRHQQPSQSASESKSSDEEVQFVSDNDDDDPITKRHLKAATDKLDQLLSSSSANPYSEAALKALFSSAVKEPLLLNAKRLHLLWKPLLKTAELSHLGVARKAIEVDSEELHSKLDDRLTQLEVELVVENKFMDELDKRTSQLKVQNLKLHTATPELNDLKSEREVIRSSIIGEVDEYENEEDDIDDIITGAPSKPDLKFKPSEQELREKLDHLEKEMKEKELL
ncbi:uncharacterized protein LOC111885110 [Lactuca sativa]|uniref:uncharacterized protein LOC111885110 n=1 Tax=Lactuca sativa TaxID=4236 RepID=UPI000CD87BA0|nr:uncharacterized protein LOC111885110 [Lactuca sativa]